jgi:type II restriction/modification system DNA methylase subunit YeeA
MDLLAFQAKWRGVTLTERSASQSHFNDLCALFGVPTPVEADPTGEWYTFEKGATKATGGKGWADVWRRGAFGWEYKGHHADLVAAYRQLQLYRDDLENPPLLVVCDLDRFEVHTNFTGTTPDVHRFDLARLSDPVNLRVLRAVFTDPLSLRPRRTAEAVTEDAAQRFGALAGALHGRGIPPEAAAHFLVQLLFCLFAEDTGLVPKGLFGELLAGSARAPERFPARAEALLVAMRDGGDFGATALRRFNGGLFTRVEPVPLTGAELADLAAAASLDWGSVEPAIFGTLFERSLDPAKRAQLGAHYTGKEDIVRVVEPVVAVPLRRRWGAVRKEADRLAALVEAAPTPQIRRNRQATLAGALGAFREELRGVRVLDPACGSGNFLYVALAALLDLEKEVLTYGAAHGLPLGFPLVGPGQLAGLELNAYARELAQAVVWIGYLQWLNGNGFPPGSRDPILEPLETIRLQDALLDRSDPERPKEAVWPEADFIMGNPPFLGDKKMRGELGVAYTDALWSVFRGRIPSGSDLVCYFFEKARSEIEKGITKRAGLLATTTIRTGANRIVLDRIKQSGGIFTAWSDEPWLLEGASVRISIVGFDDGTERERSLDGRPVQAIYSNLTSGFDASAVARLDVNRGIGFIGVQPSGSFEVTEEAARAWIGLPVNVNGKPNSDVLRPFVTAADILRRPAIERFKDWIIDFGPGMSENEAAGYEAPFEFAVREVRPVRLNNNRRKTREFWWIHGEARPGMRAALENLPRFLVSPIVAKHRIFVWMPPDTLAGNKCLVFARADDYFFGVLQSRVHEVWSLKMASRHGGERPAYHVEACFETFPFPWTPGREAWRDPRLHAIADAARTLDERRRAWLDPPGATAAELKTRTLTNLYNARPAWLAQAHAALDRAVWAAYGWEGEPGETPDETTLERLLALNGDRAG